MQITGIQLVLSITLIFIGYSHSFCQSDTILYKGMVAVEMLNGAKDDFNMADDEIYRTYGSMLSMDSSTMKPLYCTKSLFFNYHGNLDSLIECNSYSFDLGNLLIIQNKKLSNGNTNIQSCFFYLLFEVEMYYVNNVDSSLIVPNLYKSKNKEPDYMKVSIPIKEIIRVVRFEPLIKDSVRRMIIVND